MTPTNPDNATATSTTPSNTDHNDAVATLETVGGRGTGLTPAHGQLSPEQRQFLSRRLSFDTDSACARSFGLHPETPGNWKRLHPAFRAAYDELMTNGIEEWANAERRRLLGKALLTAESLLTAEDTVRARDGKKLGTAPAWRARRDGTEAILRANGLWNPQERGGAGGADTVVRMLEALQAIQARATLPPPGPATRDIIEGTATASVLPASPEPEPEP